MSAVIFFVTIFATAVAIDYVPTCGEQRAKFTHGEIAGCLCRFNNGTQKCITTFSTYIYGQRNFTFLRGAIADGYGNGCASTHQRVQSLGQFDCDGGRLAGICNPGEDEQCCNTDEQCESCNTGAFCDKYTAPTTTTKAYTTTTTTTKAETETTITVGPSTENSKLAATAFAAERSDQTPVATTRSMQAHSETELSITRVSSIRQLGDTAHVDLQTAQNTMTDVSITTFMIDIEEDSQKDQSAEQSSTTLLFIIVLCSATAICLANVAWWLFKMIREEKSAEKDNENAVRDFSNYAVIGPMQNSNADYVSIDIDAVVTKEKASEFAACEPYNVLPTKITHQATGALKSATNSSPYHQGLSALAKDHYCDVANL